MTQPPYDPSSQQPPDPLQKPAQDPYGQPPPPYGQQPPPYGQQPPPYGQQPPPYGQQPPPYGQQPPQNPYGYTAAPPPAAGYGFQQQPAFPGMQVDPASGLSFPPGVELASVGRRIGAYFLDILLAIVTLIIGYIIWTLIVWSRGQSPAKQVLGMRCYKFQEGRAATWGTMFLRWLGYIVEGIIPFGTIISFVMVCVTPQRRAIHDHIAGTVVVNDPNKVLAPQG